MNRKESKKKWRQANAERLRIYQQNYRAKHREEGRIYMQKYRARKKKMMVGEGDIIQQAMEASQTFDPLDDFVFNHSERPSNQSNAVDAIDFGFSQGVSVSSTVPNMPQTSAQKLERPFWRDDNGEWMGQIRDCIDGYVMTVSSGIQPTSIQENMDIYVFYFDCYQMYYRWEHYQQKYFSQKQFYNIQLCGSYGGRDHFDKEGLLILDK